MSSRTVAGVLLDREDAALLARTLAVVERLGERHGFRLDTRVTALAALLADASADASIRASADLELDLVGLAPTADPLVTTATAARILGISTHGVRDLLRRGRLLGVRHDGRWLVDPNSIHDYRRGAHDG